LLKYTSLIFDGSAWDSVAGVYTVIVREGNWNKGIARQGVVAPWRASVS
jgi:hypothetical protein